MNDVKKLAIQFVEAFNEHDSEALKRLFTPDVEWVVPGATLRGRAQIASLEQSFWQAFPDGMRTIDRLVAEGLTVVEEGTFSGTHLGTFQTPGGAIPATQNRVSFTYVLVMETKGDEISSKHFYFDTQGLLAQFGAVPAEASA